MTTRPIKAKLNEPQKDENDPKPFAADTSANARDQSDEDKQRDGDAGDKDKVVDDRLASKREAVNSLKRVWDRLKMCINNSRRGPLMADSDAARGPRIWELNLIREVRGACRPLKGRISEHVAADDLDCYGLAMCEHLIHLAKSSFGLRAAKRRDEHLIGGRVISGADGVEKTTSESIIIFRHKLLKQRLLITSREKKADDDDDCEVFGDVREHNQL